MTRSTFAFGNPEYVSDIVVEFDGPTGRERKAFKTSSQAKRFYVRKSTEGKNPQVVSARRG